MTYNVNDRAEDVRFFKNKFGSLVNLGENPSVGFLKEDLEGHKFMEDPDNDFVKYLMGDMCTPDQYEGHELPSSQTDNGTASRKRKSKFIKSEENSNSQCASPRRKMRSKFREQIMKILSKPYDKQEHKELLQAITEQKNQYRHIDLRGEEVKFCRTNKKGKSYLDHHGDLKRKVEAAVNDDHKQLNLLRGFYFWIQNLTQDESFMPWNDKECLAVQPQDC